MVRDCIRSLVLAPSIPSVLGSPWARVALLLSPAFFRPLFVAPFMTPSPMPGALTVHTWQDIVLTHLPLFKLACLSILRKLTGTLLPMPRQTVSCQLMQTPYS